MSYRLTRIRQNGTGGTRRVSTRSGWEIARTLATTDTDGTTYILDGRHGQAIFNADGSAVVEWCDRYEKIGASESVAL